MIVFVKCYYDVGDVVFIDEQMMIVKSVSILTTVFEQLDGKLVYHSNSLLSTKIIKNIRRSGHMSEEVSIEFPILTTRQNLESLRTKMDLFLAQSPKVYYPKFKIVVSEINAVQGTIRCVVPINYKFNHQNLKKALKHKNDFMDALKDAILEITTSLPEVKTNYQFE